MMNLKNISKRQIVVGSILTGVVFIVFGSLITGVTMIYISSNENNSLDNDANEQEIESENDMTQVDGFNLEQHEEALNIDLEADLSTEEIEDLLFMREEEKLAEEVYLALYDKWGVNIFQNIAKSEQKHTDSIKTLIDAYGLEDPYLEGEGNYTNPDLSNLYNDLVSRGLESIEEALKVGALIEDLDIVDLEDAMSRTDNQSIIMVYENLQRGSRNHIRSFTSNLSNYGESYEPQYLSQDEYDEIIAGSHERGQGNNGGGKGNHGNQ